MGPERLEYEVQHAIGVLNEVNKAEFNSHAGSALPLPSMPMHRSCHSRWMEDIVGFTIFGEFATNAFASCHSSRLLPSPLLPLLAVMEIACGKYDERYDESFELTSFRDGRSRFFRLQDGPREPHPLTLPSQISLSYHPRSAYSLPSRKLPGQVTVFSAWTLPPSNFS
jgi:hypothetical protein